MSLQIQLKKSAVSQKQPFASDLAVGELALNYHADGPFLTCKDTAGNVRKLNHVWVGTTAPSSPSAGDQWLDTSSTTAVLKIYKDSSATWVGAASIPIATTSIYGTVQLATTADVTNGTSGKIVDAAQLQSKITTELSAGSLTFDNVDLAGNLVVGGDLTVNGTTTTIDTATLVVEDKNIEMGAVDTPTDTTADGGGLTLKGASDKTFNWVNATDSWTSSENLDLASGKSYYINGAEVLNSTTLGSGVTSSSLTSVGTIGTGTWEGTTVATDHGGTGQTSYTDGQLLIGKTDGTLAKATLTAGSNVTITNGDGTITVASTDTDTTYTAGDGLDLVGTEFSADLKTNGGLVIETGELAVDLAASSITGTLTPSDGGTGQTTYSNGQLLIGKTDGTLAKNTLTAGSNITITNADGAITIAAVGSLGVTDVTATSPLASTGGATPDISIQDGTTTQKGAVQLEDSTSSTSTTTAATPNSVKSAYDLANAAAKYDDTTANFTGTLQNGGSNVVVDSDIGSTVQAYDADTAKLDVVQTFTAVQTLTDPAIIGTILEDVYTISDGAAFEIDPGNGSVQLITLGDNRTPKATNFAAGEAVTLMVDDGTAYALTWTDATFGGSGVVWKTDAGSAPTLNTSGYTVIVLWKVGSQVYGARVGDA